MLKRVTHKEYTRSLKEPPQLSPTYHHTSKYQEACMPIYSVLSEIQSYGFGPILQIQSLPIYLFIKLMRHI